MEKRRKYKILAIFKHEKNIGDQDGLWQHRNHSTGQIPTFESSLKRFYRSLKDYNHLKYNYKMNTLIAASFAQLFDGAGVT